MAHQQNTENQPDEAEKKEGPSQPPKLHDSENSPVADNHRMSHWGRFSHWYGQRKKWTVPLTVLLFLLLLAAIPITRYTAAGLVLKRDVSVKVTDSTTNTPVSGATVSTGAISGQTDAAGKATLHSVKAGKHTFLITKKYYKDASHSFVVPILNQKTIPNVELTATGRQVKITVTNSISGVSLAGVNIAAAGATAKTDSSGSAVMVVPVGVTEQKGTLSLKGYNDSDVTIKASNDKIQDNNFEMTPNGTVYFLSKLSGKIDVVKTNLDGTDRKTVVAGTGQEEDGNTVLLASRDWKYLALLSRRAGNSPSLYLIDTSNDSLTTIDEGDAAFSLNGWVNGNFVYTVTRNNVQLWQPKRQAIKSYDASSKKMVTLDQTNSSGTGNFDYTTQLIGDVYAYDSQVYYIMNWSSSYYSTIDVSSKQATFNSIKPDGTSKKTIKSFSLAPGTSAIDVSVDQRVEKPDKINLHFSDGTKDNYYVYTNGQVKDNPTMTSEGFYGTTYPTYLESPSGNTTFWSESRDGKNTLFIGDEEGANSKQIATLSEYDTYGWYTDNYLFVSKSGSELYIMPKDGSKTPLKVSDYHKPARSFNGYGGGYGGL